MLQQSRNSGSESRNSDYRSLGAILKVSDLETSATCTSLRGSQYADCSPLQSVDPWTQPTNSGSARRVGMHLWFGVQGVPACSMRLALCEGSISLRRRPHAKKLAWLRLVGLKALTERHTVILWGSVQPAIVNPTPCPRLSAA